MGKLDDGVPEQQATVVAQLKAEKANAEAYGNKSRVEAIDKQLKNLAESRGDKPEEKKVEAAEKRSQAQPQHQPPVQRTPRPGVQQTNKGE